MKIDERKITNIEKEVEFFIKDKLPDKTTKEEHHGIIIQISKIIKNQWNMKGA